MTAAAQAPDAPRRRLRRVSKEQLNLLVGLPVLVLLVGGGWAWWRATADLDTIEERTLAWSSVAGLALEHVYITLVCAVIVVAIAVPLGVLLTRAGFRKLVTPVTAVANIGQAAPAIGLLVLLAMWLGFGTTTAIIGLTAYAILPVLQNTITGLLGVDQTLVEAARGMGMSRAGVLFRLELPLAIPVIMSGIRTALVLLVGTATFAVFIDAGGLGGLITTGITLFRYPVLVSGALIVALLALVVDWAGRVLEMIFRPKGL